MEKESKRILTEFGNIFTAECSGFEELKNGVSRKMILRIFAGRKTFIGIYNGHINENLAFFSFTKSFSECGLNVPEILHVSNNRKIYFLNDLGEKTLYDYISLSDNRKKLLDFYSRAVQDLVKFQVFGKSFADFSYCYETLFFNESQIKTDFEKFRDYYLKKLTGRKLTGTAKYLKLFYGKILNNTPELFMYRDFQPRNIIKNGNKLSYVDYQSGRYGPPQYDLISFLYSGSIDITGKERRELADVYYDSLSKYVYFDRNYFYGSLKYFALLRIVQLLGSYCYSYFENKNPMTLGKIPRAITNLKTLDFREKEFRELKKIILETYS